jgi:hypothetical protein
MYRTMGVIAMKPPERLTTPAFPVIAEFDKA